MLNGQVNGAGVLHQRVAIDREDRTPDGGGGFTKAWTEIAIVWAEIFPANAREQLAAERLEGSTVYRVRVRRHSVTAGVTIAHRLRWVTNGAKVMNVIGIMDRGPREALIEYLAETGVAS